MERGHLPDTGRFGVGQCGATESTHLVHLADSDTRRTIIVTLPNLDGFDPPDHDPYFLIPVKNAADALAEHLDNLPRETVAVEFDAVGKLVSFSTDPETDITPGTDHFLLEEYQLPARVACKTVLRSQVTELGRIAGGVDLVSYHPHIAEDKNRYVFKYSPSSAIAMWAELHMLARLPPHPNLALLDRLVLDEVTGSQVVGFTMRYVAGETLDKSRPPFKLKWLSQLMKVVDDLNLKHGIIHQDIAHRNLLVDSDTDSIVLIDFNSAHRIGINKRGGQHTEGKWQDRDDVKGVLMFMYEFITRDPALELHYMMHEHDENDFKDPAKWAKHQDVELDNDVAEFYFELMAWVRKRRSGKQLTHYTEAPEHIDWPDLPETALTMEYFCCERRRTGTPYLEWTRPATSKLDPTRRLLATGRYADEEVATQTATAVDAKTTEAAALAFNNASTAEFVGAKGRSKHAGRPERRRRASVATPDRAGETVSGRVRRKLPARQVKLAKRNQGDGAVAAVMAADGPARRRSSRRSTHALPART